MAVEPDAQTAADAALVARCLRGDESAATALVQRYQRGVFTFVRRMVGRWEAAEDVTQEAFMKAFAALDRYDPRRRFSSWMLKIAYNTAIDHIRRRRPEAFSLDAPPPGAEDAEPQWADVAANPTELSMRRETLSAVTAGVAQLPPAYRAAVLLRYIHQCSYNEMVEVLDLPLGTVKTHIHRGRTQLANWLEREGYTPAEMLADE